MVICPRQLSPDPQNRNGWGTVGVQSVSGDSPCPQGVPSKSKSPQIAALTSEKTYRITQNVSPPVMKIVLSVGIGVVFIH